MRHKYPAFCGKLQIEKVTKRNRDELKSSSRFRIIKLIDDSSEF